MYKLVNQPTGGQFVQLLADSACIPFDPANSDYQAYLKWLDAGGVVLEADASAEEGNTQG